MRALHKQLRVVVFGGSGFIGTRLVSRLLSGGHDVTIADIANSRSYPKLTFSCDVRDARLVREACRGSDVIYNLAAVHRDDVRPRSLYHEVNVCGSSNICEAANELGVLNIIFTSSVAVYGFGSGELDEGAPPAPFNDYGITKLEAEGVYKAWLDERPDRSLVIVRPTVVFGEGNRGNVFTLIDQIARNRFAIVGDGTNVKSIAYVENVAAFLEHVLGCEPGMRIYRDIYGTSTSPYMMATDPDPRFGELPPDALSAYTMGKLFDGSVRDPSGAQGYLRGTGGTIAALKTVTLSSDDLSFSFGQWVVASFLLERLVASNDAPYFSFRINNGWSDGAWESPFYGLYTVKPTKGMYHMTLATRALTAAAATSLVIYIFPYGAGNTGQSWAWRASPVFAYVVDHPAKIRPYVNQRALISASAAPTVGTWALGDRIYDSAPAGSGTIGWVCTAAGSPGTWKAFGSIQA